ncbi:MAG TPA: DUF72 domain-containing protein [Abditibacteriaceae bacterium]|jgi:uncharacterized protein YecE (DUF72 family)
MAIHIGTSGWSYNHWQGILYPDRTPSTKRLHYYLQRYDTVEVNNTFYRWPRDEVFAGWRDQLPDGFQMTVKASRVLTHNKKLNEPHEWVERIVQGVRTLDNHLGVLLFQLPPMWGFNAARLETFLQALPSDVKVAVEFRHHSWHNDETFSLLGKYGVAYCVMSGAGLPCILRTTAPFVYVRFHGPDEQHLYAGSYSDDALQWWAKRIEEWHVEGKDVWAYFNNDGQGYALYNAETLKIRLGL